jgi:hypothetical protein
MRSDAQRIAKYLAKTVPATMSLKIASVLSTMKTDFASVTDDLVEMEIALQGMLNGAGVPTIQYPFYLSFGRELWALGHTGISGDSATGVAQDIKDKWEGQGLASATLIAIAADLFSIVVT